MSPALAGGFFTIRGTWEAGGRRGLGEGGCMKRVCQFQGCKADLCDCCLTAFRVLQERIGEGGGGPVRLDHL